jgi:hypothetical protein
VFSCSQEASKQQCRFCACGGWATAIACGQLHSSSSSLCLCLTNIGHSSHPGHSEGFHKDCLVLSKGMQMSCLPV